MLKNQRRELLRSCWVWSSYREAAFQADRQREVTELRAFQRIIQKLLEGLNTHRRLKPRENVGIVASIQHIPKINVGMYRFTD
jgi:hypothetical protein